MKYDCPKCNSKNAWLRRTEVDLLLVCYCGFQKVLFTLMVDTLEGPLEDDEQDEGAKLPMIGTNLYKTLVVLSILPEGTSKDITDRMNELNGLLKVPGRIIRKDIMLTVSDVSSYLTILRGKGLVYRVVERRGIPGGSTWSLTAESELLLELKEGV